MKRSEAFGPAISSQAQTEYWVRARFHSMVPGTREELEDAMEQIHDLLSEHACDVALGPAAACNFETGEVEVRFAVCASSVEEMHQKVGQVLRTLEAHGALCWQVDQPGADATEIRVACTEDRGWAAEAFVDRGLWTLENREDAEREA